jgi:hypothetical protein
MKIFRYVIIYTMSIPELKIIFGCIFSWYRLIIGCLVQVGAWSMHLFMVQVDYKFMYRLMHGSGLLVHVYNNISHSDSVTFIPSFYFYFRAVGQGKDRWL